MRVNIEVILPEYTLYSSSAFPGAFPNLVSLKTRCLIFSIPVVIVLVLGLVCFMVAIVGVVLFSETEVALFDSSNIDKDLFHVCELSVSFLITAFPEKFDD